MLEVRLIHYPNYIDNFPPLPHSWAPGLAPNSRNCDIPDGCMSVAIVWVTVALAALLVANWRRAVPGVWITKPLASAGFIYAAVVAGAVASSYGRLILLALVLSLAGDVLLIPNSPAWFKLGLVSFLLAHVAFATAFVHRGIAPRAAAFAIFAAGLLGFGVFRWLRPHLPRKMIVPVAAYIITIVAMAGLAIATSSFAQHRG